ncbi:MAG TPA: glycerophosphodiester phosphodiesterase [Burkholderiaceae bacterium]|nr:glycerophosphodiester phosphodiesterase [Burkholderiaceae bacterium]
MPYAHHQPWPYPRVLAHRGAGARAPENTLAALRLGRRLGFEAVEFDAVLAADGVAVLMHDASVARTTGVSALVSALTSRQLAALDAGHWFGPEFAGEPVPTLEQAMSLCRQQGTWMNVEIKPTAGAEAETGRQVAAQVALIFADAIRPHGDQVSQLVPQVPLLSSFSTQALQAARAAAPDVPRAWLTQRVTDGWADVLETHGCVALHTDHTELTAQLAQAIKQAGYWLFCYTVNDPARAAMLRHWGVDAFCTDQLNLNSAVDRLCL